MTTANFADWTGNMMDIGPIYPFVGSEVFWFITSLIAWIIWHIWQARMESKTYQEDQDRFGDRVSLQKIMIDSKL